MDPIINPLSRQRLEDLRKKLEGSNKGTKVGVLVSVYALFLFLAISASFSFRDPILDAIYPKPVSYAASDDVEALTDKLLEEKRNYDKSKANPLAPSSYKRSISGNLQSIASTRKHKLLKLLESSPAAFLREAKLVEERDSFPKEVSGFLEERVKGEGVLRVFHSDNFEERKSTYGYVLDMERKQYDLEFAKESPSFRFNGTRVSVEALSVGGKAVIDTAAGLKEDPTKDVLGTASGGTTSIQSLGGGAITTLPSEINMAVIIAHVRGADPGSLPTADEYRSAFFGEGGSVKNFYQEVTGGRLNVRGEVFGPYFTDVEADFEGPSNCDWFDAVANEAYRIAQLQGVDLTPYTYRVIATQTHVLVCGAGRVGPPSAKFFIGENRAYMLSSVASHEMGHVLGLGHANTWSCHPFSTNEPTLCDRVEYGDVTDVMGSGGLVHFNAPHKLALGLFSDTQVQNISSDGVYTVYAHEVNNGQDIKLLKVSTPGNSAGNYYLSFRQAVGFDVALYNYYLSGAHINMASADIDTYRFDPMPGTPSYESFRDGDVFFDQIKGISIKQVSHTLNSATVEVKFGFPKVSYSLNTGWNLIGVPLDINVSSSDVIARTGGACDQIYEDAFRINQSATIQGPQAYFIRCSQPASFELSGPAIYSPELRSPFNTSSAKLISVGKDYNKKASDFLSASFSEDCYKLSKWSGQGFITFFKGNPDNDFDLRDHEGYYVNCGPQLSTSVGSISPGGLITVLWENVATPNAYDLLALTTSSGSYTEPNVLVFTNSCSSNPGTTTPPASGSCQIQIPNSMLPGSYKFQFLPGSHPSNIYSPVFSVINGTTFSIPIVAGLNFINIPVQIDPLSREQFLAQTNGVCTEVYDDVKAAISSPPGSQASNITGGKAYFVKCSGATTLQLFGQQIITNPTLNLGWNSVSVPYGFAKKVGEFLNENSNSTVNCIEANRWYNGGWQPAVKISSTQTINNFDMKDTEGYYVKCEPANTITVNYSLTSSWNLINIPVDIVNKDVGNILTKGDLLGATGNICTEVYANQADTSDPSKQVASITGGKAYFLKCSGSASMSIRGTPKTGMPSVSSGTQLISLPKDYSQTAGAFMNSVSTPTLNCNEVNRFINGGWQPTIKFSPTFTFRDFTMKDTEGYLLKCQ